MAIDPSLLGGVVAVVEKAVNTALRYDPASRQQAAALSDILALTLTSPVITLYCCGSAEGIHIMSHCERAVTTRVTATLIDLLTLVQQSPVTLANSKVDVVGSTRLLQQWQQLLQQLDIDWEEALSDVMGDIASPLLAQAIAKHLAWLRQQQRQQGQVLRNYLEEEIGLLPSAAEYADFGRHLDDLVLSVDRAAARLERLQQRVTERTAAPSAPEASQL
ncbi:MAG: hypothetical protein KTR20_10535 [Cellvibrionaceae bacterium]|nr:hypothetical protein [Cellvibrionaceae bacterium]